MRVFGPAMTALALMSLAATAYAETADGQIVAIDPEAMTVTLDAGGVFKVERSGMLNDINTGDSVTIEYETKDGENVASEIIDHDG